MSVRQGFLGLLLHGLPWSGLFFNVRGCVFLFGCIAKRKEFFRWSSRGLVFGRVETVGEELAP